MRYTTVIDITESRDVYRSHTARLVYLHMALRCGYHDDDRDIMTISIRSLAMDVGVTVSAARCALALLQRHGVITKEPTGWRVRKWVPTITASSRKQVKISQQDADAARRREEQRLERERQAVDKQQAYIERMAAAKQAYETNPNSYLAKLWQTHLDQEAHKNQSK